jgi:sulfofructose kinase
MKDRPLQPLPSGATPFDVVGCGTNSVDHLCVVRKHPRLDSKQTLVAYDVQAGGQVPTAMVALQRWGLRTAYIGAFGDDPPGTLARESLTVEGIDVTACALRENTANQVSVILVDEVSGERAVLGQKVETLVLRADELRRADLVRGRVLLLDAVDIDAAIRAARWAREAGVLTVLDTDDPGPGFDELLRYTDVLIVAAGFVQRLTGLSSLRAALRATGRRGPRFVGTTLGAGGALAFASGRLHYAPAFRVPVVDSTGAGDVFHAGAIYGLLQGWPVPEILRFATVAAALKCEKLGARPGIPTLQRTLSLARGQRGAETGRR